MKRKVGIIALIIFASFIFLRSESASAVQVGNHVMTVQEINIGGRKYSLVTVVGREKREGMPQDYFTLSPYAEDVDYIPNLLKYVQKWILNTYVELGRIKKGSKFYKEFSTTESIVDDRSSLIFITEYNDLTQIKATMRVTFRGENPENSMHPLENRLGVRETDEQYQDIVLGDGSQALTVEGESVEWKNIIKAPGQEEDFLAVLLWRAATGGIFNTGFRMVPWKGMMRFVVPKYIIGECDSTMEHYYRETWGFATRYIKEKESYVFKQLRTSFLTKLSHVFKGRGGAELLKRMNVKEVIFRPAPLEPPLISNGADSCEAHLSDLSPVPFFDSIEPSAPITQ